MHFYSRRVVWLTVLVAVFRWSCCPLWPELSYWLTRKLQLMVSYCTVRSHVWKQRFLVQCGWWLKWTIFFVLSVSFLFSPLSLFCTKTNRRSCGFSVPPVSVSQHHESGCLWTLSLKTLYTQRDEFFVWPNVTISWEIIIFLPVHWKKSVIQSVHIFCQIVVFCQMLCFNRRCLIVSKKIKVWTYAKTCWAYKCFSFDKRALSEEIMVNFWK